MKKIKKMYKNTEFFQKNIKKCFYILTWDRAQSFYEGSYFFDKKKLYVQEYFELEKFLLAKNVLKVYMCCFL